jgi:hypothetical protein
MQRQSVLPKSKVHLHHARTDSPADIKHWRQFWYQWISPFDSQRTFESAQQQSWKKLDLSNIINTDQTSASRVCSLDKGERWVLPPTYILDLSLEQQKQ